MSTITISPIYCPQCDRDVRVTEPYAFGGRDKLRATLGCGHVVLRRCEDCGGQCAHAHYCPTGGDVAYRA
jgi:hypothetical protein